MPACLTGTSTRTSLASMVFIRITSARMVRRRTFMVIVTRELLVACQTFETVPGQLYRLDFDVYSGNWDGRDTDVVEVAAGDLDAAIDVAAEHL